jgi:hypothetical protein
MIAEEIAANKRKLDMQIEQVVQQLSSADEDSLVHRVQKAGDGLVIAYTYPNRPPVYLYALPWSRGWSVFVTNDDAAGVYSWRDVPKKYRHLQAALHTPRGTVGPHHVHPNRIVHAILELVKPLDKLNRTRIRRANRLEYATDTDDS